MLLWVQVCLRVDDTGIDAFFLWLFPKMLLPLLFSFFLLSWMSMRLVGDGVDIVVDIVIAGVVVTGSSSCCVVGAPFGVAGICNCCCGSSPGHPCWLSSVYVAALLLLCLRLLLVLLLLGLKCLYCIWAIYYRSLTWIKAILGRIPLLNYLLGWPRLRSL